MQIDISEVAAKLWSLLEAAGRGEDVVITRDGQAIAKVVAVSSDPLVKKRVFGALKGRIGLGPEFFEPLPEDELALWEGGEDAGNDVRK
jgi:antitoxin (DNA-binding transcriptional repressor) of toxin-antitoxin stability system